LKNKTPKLFFQNFHHFLEIPCTGSHHGIYFHAEFRAKICENHFSSVRLSALSPLSIDVFVACFAFDKQYPISFALIFRYFPNFQTAFPTQFKPSVRKLRFWNVICGFSKIAAFTVLELLGASHNKFSLNFIG